ncbi:YraN family protein [Leucobacter luti]|uniref:UPF0102 protein EV139_2081 n=1 Tax=Leucobacter luti TaxID=340320 RepID=A0A4Q7TWX7_9MICO|nr:YraN family protein [Leucobacter luti]MBL3698257.1 YraN family protein [Leucobacter luti]RZT64660.1 putative endonuclease [Leucobacter luti]
MNRAPESPTPRRGATAHQAHEHEHENRTLGARGEAIAADYLAKRGCRVLARNWHSAYGELDLVVCDGDTLVAVEVKTRAGAGYGDPLTAITARKVARLRRLLFEWSRTNRARGARLRIDAIGITIRPGQEPLLDHLRGVS